MKATNIAVNYSQKAPYASPETEVLSLCGEKRFLTGSIVPDGTSERVSDEDLF